MKIWIIGRNGQLATALIDCCCTEKIPFIASSRKDIDVIDLEALKKKCEAVQCTHIINCAGYTDVDGAEKNVKQAYDVNSICPENLGIIARENGLHVVHVSTDYVFRGDKETPYKETDSPSPLGVYGKSKWEGELRLLDQFPSACIVRTSWIFGYQGKNFISSIISKLQNEPEIRAVEDQINRATYNRDLAKALLDLCCHTGVFHFANSKPLTRYQIVEDFYNEARRRNLPLKCQKILPISFKEIESLSPRPNYSVLDTQKVTRALGRKPRLWETVLGEYFDHVSSLY